MATRRVTYSVLLAFAACPLAAAAAQRQPAPSIEQLMSVPDRRATGMAKLTPAERDALARWVARQRELAATAAAGIPVRKAPPALAMEPPAAEPAPGAPASPPMALPPVAPADSLVVLAERRMAMPAVVQVVQRIRPGRHVRYVFDDGRTVLLDDGSIWEIGHEHRTTADGWQRGDFVTIERIAAPTGDYVFRLVHAESRNGAAARLVDRTR